MTMIFARRLMCGGGALCDGPVDCGGVAAAVGDRLGGASGDSGSSRRLRGRCTAGKEALSAATSIVCFQTK